MEKNTNVISYLNNPQNIKKPEDEKNQQTEQQTQSTPIPATTENVVETEKKIDEPKKPTIPNISDIVSKAAESAVKDKESKKKKIEKPTAKVEPKEEENVENLESIIDEDKQTLATLEQLENIMPDKYKGIKNKAVKYLKEASEVAKKEQKKFYEENKDLYEDEEQLEQAFEEHLDTVISELKEKHGVNWEEEDFNKAQKELEKKPIVEELNKTKQEVQEIKKQRVIEQVAPICQNVTKETLSMLASILTNNQQKDLEPIKEDEIIGDYVKQAEQHLAMFNTALIGSMYGLTDEKTLNYISQLVSQAEKEVMSIPDNQRVINGKAFIPVKDYNELDDESKKMFWTITPDVLLMREVNNVANYINTIKQKEEERVNKIIEKRYKYIPKTMLKSEIDRIEKTDNDNSKSPFPNNLVKNNETKNQKPVSPSIGNKQEVPTSISTPNFMKNSATLDYLSRGNRK